MAGTPWGPGGFSLEARAAAPTAFKVASLRTSEANLSLLLAFATPPPESGEGKEEKRPTSSWWDPESKSPMDPPGSLSPELKSLLQQRLKKEQEVAILKARIAELEQAGKQPKAAISASSGTKRSSGDRPTAAPDDSAILESNHKRQRKSASYHIGLGSHPAGDFYTNPKRIDHILFEHGYLTKINSYETGGSKTLDTKFAKEFNNPDAIIKLLEEGIQGDLERTRVELPRPNTNYTVIHYAFTFPKVGFFDFGDEDWRETNRVEIIAYKFSTKENRGQFVVTAYPVQPVAP